MEYYLQIAASIFCGFAAICLFFLAGQKDAGKHVEFRFPLCFGLLNLFICITMAVTL